ncbi:hypothetical protein ABIB48_002665 [Arthrobacter sp. UYCu511]|uniref:hypothetical protein n=1 Tax=Arthrobacter sp. UYCu511 TaxID=3156337 RepID=UPI00339A0530
MSDPVYTLSWPRTLFVWEATRILHDAKESELVPWTKQLLRESFDDEGTPETFEAKFSTTTLVLNSWDTPSPTPSTENSPRLWLKALTTDESRLRAYQSPVYFAERHSDGLVDSEPSNWISLGEEFIELIGVMSAGGYFPKILPKECQDNDQSDSIDVSKEIRRATKLKVDWPLTSEAASLLPDVVVFTLIEYFHDHAQRPRAAVWHNWDNCGYDYSQYNRESGEAVYRWRVNALLESHTAALRLGMVGAERGRLIHHFSRVQDTLLADEVENRKANPVDEVAHAIRMFRARDANNIDKRAALALLAGRLEPKRKYLEGKTSKGDVDDIFKIANTYEIRHRVNQKSEEREEYLEWMFWNFLSMVRLLDALEARHEASVASRAANDSSA